MKNVNKYEVIKDIKAAMSDNAIDFTDEYFGHAGCDYISDLFHEFADNHTSIYYSDIIKYISEHVEDVNRAIEEFGWDGCGSDLYKAGQMAEYEGIYQELEEDRENILKLVTLYALPEKVPAEMWEELEAEIDPYADRWPDPDDITERVNEWIEDHKPDILGTIDKAAAEMVDNGIQGVKFEGVTA